jgi:hypothetical protein
LLLLLVLLVLVLLLLLLLLLLVVVVVVVVVVLLLSSFALGTSIHSDFHVFLPLSSDPFSSLPFFLTFDRVPDLSSPPSFLPSILPLLPSLQKSQFNSFTRLLASDHTQRKKHISIMDIRLNKTYLHLPRVYSNLPFPPRTLPSIYTHTDVTY